MYRFAAKGAMQRFFADKHRYNFVADTTAWVNVFAGRDSRTMSSAEFADIVNRQLSDGCPLPRILYAGSAFRDLDTMEDDLNAFLNLRLLSEFRIPELLYQLCIFLHDLDSEGSPTDAEADNENEVFNRKFALAYWLVVSQALVVAISDSCTLIGQDYTRAQMEAKRDCMVLYLTGQMLSHDVYDNLINYYREVLANVAL